MTPAEREANAKAIRALEVKSTAIAQQQAKLSDEAQKMRDEITQLQTLELVERRLDRIAATENLSEEQLARMRSVLIEGREARATAEGKTKGGN